MLWIVHLAIASSAAARVYPVRLGLIGDQGIGKHPKQVLRLIRDYGAQAILHAGDFDYTDSPKQFMKQHQKVMGKRFPMLAAVGNHDITKWGGSNGYQDRLMRLNSKSGLSKHCSGEYGVNMVCDLNGIIVVVSGIGTLGSDHVQFITDSLSKYSDSPWKICLWHKNQANFQTGDKTDETGYGVYEACRMAGAIIVHSHDHAYARTHLMSSFETATIASNASTLHISPGNTFAVVTGLGGESIRPWAQGRQLNPWWAATAALDNGVNFGALLCTFNVGGDPSKAECSFKDIDGVKWDSFDIVSHPPHSISHKQTVFLPSQTVSLCHSQSPIFLLFLPIILSLYLLIIY